MPKLSDEELKAAVEDGRIGAITIDTSVFDQYGCNLRFQVLQRLDQFRGTGVTVLFSDVIAGEVKAHIAAQAEEAKEKLNIALGHYKKGWRLDFDVKEKVGTLINLAADPADFAASQFDEYVEAIGAEVIATEGAVPISKIMSLYFGQKPPFSRKESKKSEFPDALALLSLEAWAAASGRLLLAVSKDGDWAKYAETSDTLVCRADIKQCFDLFNQDVRVVAVNVVSKLREGAAPEILGNLRNVIQAFLDDLDFDVEASSALSFNATQEAAVLKVINLDEDLSPLVVASDDDTVTFSIDVDATVDFDAEFSFSVKDGIDRDYVPLGSSSVSTTEVVKFPVVITVTRSVDPMPELVDAEVTRTRITADFGYVEPDWSEEAYDE